ncbi:hypothetical protein TgHK011_001335 [Trichoderma gracile]|nr:hypothetical protein TgHK011_001335 [Trichoderma gracile]
MADYARALREQNPIAAHGTIDEEEGGRPRVRCNTRTHTEKRSKRGVKANTFSWAFREDERMALAQEMPVMWSLASPIHVWLDTNHHCRETGAGHQSRDMRTGEIEEASGPRVRDAATNSFPGLCPSKDNRPSRTAGQNLLLVLTIHACPFVPSHRTLGRAGGTSKTVCLFLCCFVSPYPRLVFLSGWLGAAAAGLKGAALSPRLSGVAERLRYAQPSGLWAWDTKKLRDLMFDPMLAFALSGQLKATLVGGDLISHGFEPPTWHTTHVWDYRMVYALKDHVTASGIALRKGR